MRRPTFWSRVRAAVLFALGVQCAIYAATLSTFDARLSVGVVAAFLMGVAIDEKVRLGS